MYSNDFNILEYTRSDYIEQNASIEKFVQLQKMACDPQGGSPDVLKMSNFNNFNPAFLFRHVVIGLCCKPVDCYFQ